MTKVNYKIVILTSVQISWDDTMRNFLSMHLLDTNKNIFFILKHLTGNFKFSYVLCIKCIKNPLKISGIRYLTENTTQQLGLKF